MLSATEWLASSGDEGGGDGATREAGHDSGGVDGTRMAAAVGKGEGDVEGAMGIVEGARTAGIMAATLMGVCKARSKSSSISSSSLANSMIEFPEAVRASGAAGFMLRVHLGGKVGEASATESLNAALRRGK